MDSTVVSHISASAKSWISNLSQNNQLSTYALCSYQDNHFRWWKFASRKLPAIIVAWSTCFLSICSHIGCTFFYYCVIVRTRSRWLLDILFFEINNKLRRSIVYSNFAKGGNIASAHGNEWRCGKREGWMVIALRLDQLCMWESDSTILVTVYSPEV